MAGTKAAIDYGTVSGILRSIIDNNNPADNDADLYLGQKLMVDADIGISRLIVDRDELYKLGPHECLRQYLNIPELPNDRCAVVDANGDVVNVIHADDLIDSVDGHELINQPFVDIGWKRVAAKGPALRSTLEPPPEQAVKSRVK